MTPISAGEFVSGEQCYLRPLRRADLEGNWLNWLNDPAVTEHMLRGSMPSTVESQTAYYESVIDSPDDLVLAIVARDGDAHVGNVALHRINWQHGHAEFGIVVGERSHWRRGIGLEATRLICGHGFARLNLHRIWLGMMADNVAAAQLYGRVGFVEEGRLREEVLRDGRRQDIVIMGLLRNELLR